jgi:ferredoxin
VADATSLGVDRVKCIVSGTCEALVPALFAIDDQGELQVLQPTVPDDLLDAARDAVGSCPARALHLS